MRLKMANMVSVFEFAATGTVKSYLSDTNGWVKQMIVDMTAITTQSSVITIVDPYGYTVFTSVSCPASTITRIGDTITAAELGQIPLGEAPWKLVCTLSGAAGGSGGNVIVVTYFSL
jgi:hypothetical protein